MLPYNENSLLSILLFFFFNDTATTEIYTLSLHDALPISRAVVAGRSGARRNNLRGFRRPSAPDRKSTRLNSSHTVISYAVFCLKKKKQKKEGSTQRFNQANDPLIPVQQGIQKLRSPMHPL